MSGQPVQQSQKTLGELTRLFHDQASLAAMDPGQHVYRVQWWAPSEPGTEGGLFWGVTVLEPGKVGDEFFMTHGHSHANSTRAEYYAAVSGTGILLQMDEERKCHAEAMQAGSLHYVRGRHAHRVVNTGTEPLIFWACWGTDAGYNYGTIAARGFSVRVLERDGQPALVAWE